MQELGKCRRSPLWYNDRAETPLLLEATQALTLSLNFLITKCLKIPVRNVTAVISLLFSRKVTRSLQKIPRLYKNFNSFKTAQNYNSTWSLLNCGTTLGSNKSLHWARNSSIIL